MRIGYRIGPIIIIGGGQRHPGFGKILAALIAIAIAVAIIYQLVANIF